MQIIGVVAVILFYILPHVNAAWEVPPGVVALDSSSLSSWYDPLALCMMKESDYSNHATYWTILEKCKKLHGPTKFDDGFYSLPSSAFANKVRGCCCTEEIPIKDRGFNWVLKGHEDGNTKVVSNILNEFSKRNMSVLFLGDSMNNQIHAAFRQELIRENTTGKFEPDILRKRQWFYDASIHEQMGLNRKVFGYITDTYRWTPIDNETGKEMNPVYVYSVCIWYFNNIHEELLVKNVIIPQLVLRDHPQGVAIFGNIGHHLANERSNSNPTPLYNHLSHFLNWLHDLTVYNPHNLAFFRETSPSHFHSPDGDGSFEKWHGSSLSQYNYLEPTTWDKTMYYCKAIDNYTDSSKQFPENLAVQSLLKAWGEESTNVHILPFFQQLAPFYTLKYGNCGGWNRIDIIDCVHYCSWAPPMWIGVWEEMQKVLKPMFQKQKTYLEEKKYNTEKVYTDGPFPSFDDVIEADLKIVVSSKTGKKFSLYHGLKRPLQDDDEKVLTSHYKSLEMEKVKIVKLEDEELEKIPTGDLFEKNADSLPDKTPIKLEGRRHAEVFVMDKGVKRWIPDWSTFQALKLDPNQIVHLPQDKFDAIETGPQLPHKDFP